MPFRKKTRNPVSRPEKENEGIDATQPLSPSLIRCKSDNTHRTCSEISLNKPSSNNGNFSPEAKMSNLMQLNTALVKEIASLRSTHAVACDKFSKVELSINAENGKLLLDISSLQEAASALKEENATLLASQEELRSSLGTSRAQVEGLSVELAMVKAEVNEAMSSQKQALAASEERLTSANYELVASKEKAALVISEKDLVFEEKEVALRAKKETEDKFEALNKREKELADLLQVERKAMSDAQEIIAVLRKEVEKLLADKEDNKQKRAVEESKTSQNMQQLEESLNVFTTKVNSLTLQIEEERAVHAQAMETRLEKSYREHLAEMKSAKEDFQDSENIVKTLTIQKEQDRNKHQAETKTLKEKLIDSSQKIRAMEELLEKSNASAEELGKQLVEESANHHVSNCSPREGFLHRFGSEHTIRRESNSADKEGKPS
ncbi:hypothetical protein L7F22_005024 [Adiantum nelumboides]|nr:hypothetical protein [Adiantum nelumboides]